MRYREFPVDDALAPYVRQIWLFECDRPALFGGPERIVADGVVEAIFHYRRPFTMRFAGADAAVQPVSLLVSQIGRYVEIQPAGAGGFVSVRFHPWGAHHFLPVPMRDVGDRATPTDEVWPRRDVREVEDRIATAATDADRARAVQAFCGGVSTPIGSRTSRRSSARCGGRARRCASISSPTRWASASGVSSGRSPPPWA